MRPVVQVLIKDVQQCVYDVLVDDVDIKTVIKQTAVDRLFAVPSTIQLAGAEVELVPTISREVRLKGCRSSEGRI